MYALTLYKPIASNFYYVWSYSFKTMKRHKTYYHMQPFTNYEIFANFVFVVIFFSKISHVSPLRKQFILVQFIFFFWSFEISGNILRNQKNLFV